MKKILFLCCMLLVLAGCGDTQGNQPASAGGAEVTTKKAEKKLEPIELELTSGNYTAGIDIPAGKYDIEALKGNGNVMSTNMYNGGINAILGYPSNGLNEQLYENVKLPKDTVLTIAGGVVVKITSESVDKNSLAARNQSIKDSVDLGNGHFIAGEDFTEGVYNIVAVSGGGNVSSSNMYSGGINAIMGKPAGDFYEVEYKNIDLPKGTELSIDGVKIKLVPSK